MNNHRFANLIHRIVSVPKVYDLIQLLAGDSKIQQQLSEVFANLEDKVVLDIGAGTGTVRSLLPDSATYIWLDNDPQKLSGFKTKNSNTLALLGSASQIAIKDECIDAVLCMKVTHHLSDEEFISFLNEVSRVAKKYLILLDAFAQPQSVTSNFLWSIDRGSYPRSAELLLQMIENKFSVEEIRYFNVYHRYLLCVAKKS
jgi:ubiquinone/menaquinone biosynthesis C-methylase UbiE